jgi:hypothetical protein
MLERYETYLREEFQPRPYKGVRKEHLEPNTIATYLTLLKWISADLIGAPVRGGILNDEQDFFRIENFEELNSLVFRLENRPSFLARAKKEKDQMLTVYRNYLDFILYLRRRK